MEESADVILEDHTCCIANVVDVRFQGSRVCGVASSPFDRCRRDEQSVDPEILRPCMCLVSEKDLCIILILYNNDPFLCWRKRVRTNENKIFI